MSVVVGEIYRDPAFYIDPETGESKPKSFLILACPVRGDLVARLITSRHEDVRRENPPCFHGDPYPGFYLGVLGGRLPAKSWLDLRFLGDFDAMEFAQRLGAGRIELVMTLRQDLLRPALECAASADDTTRLQERLIRDVIAALP